MSKNTGPLSGIRVLEMGQLIAGPFSAKTLGDLGAEVIKIEPPEKGDPLRQWRLLHEGTSVWWEVQSRNKQSVAIDLRQPEGQQLAYRLAVEADILIENFRPGTLESWGMSYENLSQDNPGLIMLRISGYGQTGPYRDLPGFGAIGEAMGGLRHLTGQPGEVPVRVGLSIGDTLAALQGSIGVLAALFERQRNNGQGQVIDMALYEAVFNCTESLLPEYSAFGAIRGPAGSALPGITPSNAYPCLDGYVLIAGNGDSIYQRLMRAIGREDLAYDPDLANNKGRSLQAERIDQAISAWTQLYPIEKVLQTLAEASVPAGKIYTIKDISDDPHYRAREMIETVTTANGLNIEVPGVIPKLSRTPGSIRHRAPLLGEHTKTVLQQLGLDDNTIHALEEKGIIQ
ncbi:CoA transferase [Ferrovum sp. PN-J185]|uniref:CaiB/BaiF CoA transferase family protein n=1 Tax=Ferrovum sp. PN-J185 TaxID=1356306 RepID=UPI000791E8F6|nr:CoA transferase [Ferrovum sp. PN-J185]KXW56515.1 succinyl-CoA:(R)-benzylsuccinate CoA-transferase subunit BbsF [Ferrovum sp. PN-J185]MCC6068136.1 CoA transferase [Ferrovum sp. PN-J185]